MSDDPGLTTPGEDAAPQDTPASPAPEREEHTRPFLPLRSLLGPALALLLLSLTYSYVIPLGYGPDEPRHYCFIRLLWEGRQLSRMLPDGRELGNAIAIHPPTYYLVEGLLWYPARWLGQTLAPHARQGPLRALVVGTEPTRVPDDLLDEAVAHRVFRLTSPLWGLATLTLTFLALRSLWPSRPRLVLGATWLMALWPHALMNFGTITNDCGANLGGALFVWYWACRAPRGPGDWRHAAWAGAVTGLAGMMKGQLLLCLAPVTFVSFAWPHGRAFWHSPAFWRQALVALLVLLAIAGPWYGRNLVLYGQINYVAPGYEAIPRGMTFLDALLVGLVGRVLLATAGGLFRSIWAQVGWFPDALAPVLYALLGLLTAAALGGAILGLTARRRLAAPPLGPERTRGLAALLLPYPMILLLNIYVVLFVHFGPYQGGRYHLFALPALATALVWGWLGLPRGRWVLIAALGLFVLLNAVSLANLATYLNPVHATTVLVGQ